MIANFRRDRLRALRHPILELFLKELCAVKPVPVGSSRRNMVFVGAIETFDQLLEGTEFLRHLGAILQPDHLPQGERGLSSRAVGVEEVHAGLAGNVVVGDEAQGAIFGKVRAASPRATVAAKASRSVAT
jgi:hypothetical protein